MKHIKTVTENLARSIASGSAIGEKPSSEAKLSPILQEKLSTGNTPLSDRHIDRIWERMTSMYGHKWTSAHGEGDEDGTWQKGLTGISLDQIGIGLTGCALRNDPWPPSLPEFRAMCEQGGDRYDPTDGAQVAVRLPRSRALPEPAEHREKRRGKGKQHLADIYQRMGWRRRALGADK